MSFDDWDDLRIGLAVARTGTLSAAAKALGVHHATVIRRIDALESRLGVRLFQRHSRGYTPTDAGKVMLDVAGDAAERFAQLAARISAGGDRIEGDLIVTSLPEMDDIVMPRLVRLLALHPHLRVNYVTDVRLFRLDAGEAHIAIRAGNQPTEPDYVVQPMGRIAAPIYASDAYVARRGKIDGIEGQTLALPGAEARNAPVMIWLRGRVRPEQVVLTANDAAAREAVIRAGLAMGPLPPSRAEGLKEVMAMPEWDTRLWLVTHVDLHRSPKAQAALKVLRDAPDDWHGQGDKRQI